MTFLATVAPDEASGAVADQYAADRAALGHLPNFTRAFSLRPGAYAAWKALNGAIKAEGDLRRYELATVAAARELRSTSQTPSSPPPSTDPSATPSPSAARQKPPDVRGPCRDEGTSAATHSLRWCLKSTQR